MFSISYVPLERVQWQLKENNYFGDYFIFLRDKWLSEVKRNVPGQGDSPGAILVTSSVPFCSGEHFGFCWDLRDAERRHKSAAGYLRGFLFCLFVLYESVPCCLSCYFWPCASEELVANILDVVPGGDGMLCATSSTLDAGAPSQGCCRGKALHSFCSTGTGDTSDACPSPWPTLGFIMK